MPFFPLHQGTVHPCWLTGAGSLRGTADLRLVRIGACSRSHVDEEVVLGVRQHLHNAWQHRKRTLSTSLRSARGPWSPVEAACGSLFALRRSCGLLVDCVWNIPCVSCEKGLSNFISPATSVVGLFRTPQASAARANMQPTRRNNSAKTVTKGACTILSQHVCAQSGLTLVNVIPRTEKMRDKYCSHSHGLSLRGRFAVASPSWSSLEALQSQQGLRPCHPRMPTKPSRRTWPLKP